MIRIENPRTVGWESATRGMRNPMNSWDKSDSVFWGTGNGEGGFGIGPNDLALMKKLAAAGPDHRKFMRMLTVYVDVTAPLYWWKEADVYKVGTVCNSCSTMHKLTEKKFEWEDFSTEHLLDFSGSDVEGVSKMDCAKTHMEATIEILNNLRALYLHFDDKDIICGENGECRDLFADVKARNPGLTRKDVWWNMIQILPTSYNQRRSLMLNYEVLRNIYHARRNHKLDEWREFCKWIETLPYATELITGEVAGLINGEG